GRADLRSGRVRLADAGARAHRRQGAAGRAVAVSVPRRAGLRVRRHLVAAISNSSTSVLQKPTPGGPLTAKRHERSVSMKLRSSPGTGFTASTEATLPAPSAHSL